MIMMMIDITIMIIAIIIIIIIIFITSIFTINIILIGTWIGLASAMAYHGKLDAPAHQSPWYQLWQVL